MHREGRSHGRRRVRAGIIALAAAALGSVAFANTALAGGPGDGGLDALVLRDADSPVLDAFSAAADVDLDEGRGGGPADYELLIVDSDELATERLADHATIERFVSAGRWVMAFDVEGGDHEALASHTGFDLTGGAGGDRSEMLLFRVGMEEGTPMVEIVDSGSLSPRGGGRLSKARLAEVRRYQVRRVAALVDDRFDADARAKTTIACPTLDPAPDPDLQHVGWCYTDAGAAGVPSGFWTKGERRWWIDPYGDGGTQTANWTMNHRFDAFLNNDPTHPKGNFQTITYALNGQFNPKRPGENFFRMFDRFTSGWHGSRILERGWTTGRVDVAVTPDVASDSKLLWQASSPQSANSETSYTSGQEFSIGFTGTGARPDAGLGVGVNASMTFSNSKTHSIPDWGAENQTAGNDLRWVFSARHPCDARPNGDRSNCFETRPACCIGPWEPALPSELSRGQFQLNTTGRWRTRQLLEGEAGKLKFGLAAPVTLADAYCGAEFIGGFCGPGRGNYRTMTTGPTAESVELNAALVNPIAIKSLKLSPTTANGAQNEKVTGTVTLERPATIPINVRVLSNSGNAVLDAPLPNVSGGSQSGITIPPGKSTGTFTVKTNDNNLSPGQRTTASITAFYTEPTAETLRIERP